jgi:hypothetical protein
MTIHGLAYVYSFPDMSMLDKSKSAWDDYWVFCNKTNTDQNISLYIQGHFGSNYWWSGGYDAEGQSIENGWNKIKMSFDGGVV